MFCRECGAKVEDGVKFCTECGAPIVAESGAEETKAEETAAAEEKTEESAAEVKTEEIAAEETVEAVETAETIEKVEAEIVEDNSGAADSVPEPKAEVVVTETFDNSSSNANTYKPPIDAQWTSILAYISWIGWIVAYCAGDKENAKFHLNQALVIKLFGLAGAIPYIGGIWAIFIFVCWVMGLVYACTQEEKEVPLIGKIHLLN